VKSATLDSSQMTVSELLGAAEQNDVVFIQSNGQTRFAVVPADDSDEEVLALRSNAEFMSYLADAERRAAAGPRKTLQQIRESLGVS
jgi:hypothetical protein